MYQNQSHRDPLSPCVSSSHLNTPIKPTSDISLQTPVSEAFCSLPTPQSRGLPSPSNLTNHDFKLPLPKPMTTHTQNLSVPLTPSKINSEEFPTPIKKQTDPQTVYLSLTPHPSMIRSLRNVNPLRDAIFTPTTPSTCPSSVPSILPFKPPPLKLTNRPADIYTATWLHKRPTSK
ncbi:hypothetical protein HMI55_001348 [Coelomomyces lativittatus]|nr:hypothetical protein HMI55_001348 [Coelomomyces lativittatus]KAJ1514586.1 hypothetical protein HMI56_000173 [Coelomomyces lativittatus]